MNPKLEGLLGAKASILAKHLSEKDQKLLISITIDAMKVLQQHQASHALMAILVLKEFFEDELGITKILKEKKEKFNKV
jgi:hypothetical protein